MITHYIPGSEMDAAMARVYGYKTGLFPVALNPTAREVDFIIASATDKVRRVYDLSRPTRDIGLNALLTPHAAYLTACAPLGIDEGYSALVNNVYHDPDNRGRMYMSYWPLSQHIIAVTRYDSFSCTGIFRDRGYINHYFPRFICNLQSELVHTVELRGSLSSEICR